MDRLDIEPTEGTLSWSNATRPREENKSKIIFAVDDDTDVIAIVTSIARKAGYTVFSAASGEECLAMLWRMMPKLILLDVKMSGLDGFETCRRIRRHPNAAHIPVAFLTARKSLDDVKCGVAAGGDDFIVKPFHGAQFAERIDLLMSRTHRLGAKHARHSPKLDTPEEAPEAARATTAPSLAESGSVRMVLAETVCPAAPADNVPNPTAEAQTVKPSATRAERCSLRQIAARSLAPFLTQDAHHKAPGLIASAVIPMWWDALLAIARDQINAIQGDLDRLLPLDDVIGLDALAQTLRGVIATLTSRLADLLADTKLSSAPAIKALARIAAAPAMKLISEILLVAGPLDEAMEAFNRGLPDDMDHRVPIADLSPRLVDNAKKCYVRLGEGGVAGRLFVIAIMNRLDKPWQIFRLAHALSWHGDASVLSGTELSIIGDRLVADLNCIAATVDEAVTKTCTTSAPFDFDGMSKLVERYCEANEGVVGEIQIPSDSSWGEALHGAQAKMVGALAQERLSGIANAVLLPVPERIPPAPPFGTSPPDDDAARQADFEIRSAGQAIMFLTFVARRGDKHGFGNSARRVLEAVRAKLADRIEAVLDPRRIKRSGGAPPAYLEQAIRLVELLSKDSRGAAIVNRLKAALSGR
jgi:DNA-binding response OmpR family regulator